MEETAGSDEALVTAYQSGEKTPAGEAALDALVKRYELPLCHYALKKSRYKDQSFIDDIGHQTVLRILKALRQRRFRPTGAGSFRSWAFTVCYNVCLEENRRYRRTARPISEVFLESLPDDLSVRRPEEPPDTAVHQELTRQLETALSQLAPLDRKLVMLRQQGYSYAQIRLDPDFQENSSGQLRVKYCRIIILLKNLLKGRKNYDDQTPPDAPTLRTRRKKDAPAFRTPRGKDARTA